MLGRQRKSGKVGPLPLLLIPKVRKVLVYPPLPNILTSSGPEIRTGNTKDDADIPIAMGQEINITTDEKYKQDCDDKNMWVAQKPLVLHF